MFLHKDFNKNITQSHCCCCLPTPPCSVGGVCTFHRSDGLNSVLPPEDLGVMVSSFRTRRQCLSFSGRGRPSKGQRSTSGVEAPDGGEGLERNRRAHKLTAGTAACRLLPFGPHTISFITINN